MSTLSINSTSLYKKRWMALAVLCAAQFMVIMDTSIIGVALPAIQQALNYTPSELQWIFNAYVIVFGGVLLLGGKLSDLYGPKNIFYVGLRYSYCCFPSNRTRLVRNVYECRTRLARFGCCINCPISAYLIDDHFY